MREILFILFLMFCHFSRKRGEWSECEGGTRSHWATLRNWNWTLRGLCGYLVCLTDATIPALFPLSPLPVLPEQSTPRIAVRSSITTQAHTHTYIREKRKLTKAMRMLLLMTHTAVVLALSLSCYAICCPIGNWHEMTRTPTRRTLWQRRALLLLSENVCTFPIGMQHRMPMREWFHRRAAQKGTTAHTQNEVTTSHRITKTSSKAENKNKQQ